MNLPPSPSILSVPNLLTALTLYFAIDLAVRALHKTLLPAFYTQQLTLRKDAAYFAFLLGVLTTLLSTPICLSALNSHTTPLSHNPAGQLCLLSRATLWTSELNRLSHAPAYIIHHALSLAQLVWHLNSTAPMAPIYAIYASLVTELFSSTGCALSHHGLRAGNSRLARAVQKCNAWGMLLVRGSVWAYAVRHMQGDGVDEYRVGMGILAVYGLFIARIVVKEFRRLGVVRVGRFERAGGVYLCVEGVRVPLYGVFVALAGALGRAVALALFRGSAMASRERDGRETAAAAAAAAGLLGVAFVAAYLGARGPEVVSGKLRLLLDPRTCLSSTTTTTKGFWFQSGLFSVVLAIVFAPSSLDPSAREALLASGAVALLLAESVGRLGCQFGNCCGAKRRVPLLASALNGLAFMVMLAGMKSGGWGIRTAGAAALGVNASIRMLCEGLRTDVRRWRGVKGTQIFAMAQMATALYLFRTGAFLSGRGDGVNLEEALGVEGTWWGWMVCIPFFKTCTSSAENCGGLGMTGRVMTSMCGAGEGSADVQVPLLETCGSGEDSLAAVLPLASACACGEDSSTGNTVGLPACGQGEDVLEHSLMTVGIVMLTTSECGKTEDGLIRRKGADACGSGEDTLMAMQVGNSLMNKSCASGEHCVQVSGRSGRF